MTKIIIGDRVTFNHSQYPDPRSGIVTDIYTNGAGARVAVIDYGARAEWHQVTDFLTLSMVTLHCAGPDCTEIHRGLPRSTYCCPDHLDQLFGDPMWISAERVEQLRAGAGADFPGLIG